MAVSSMHLGVWSWSRQSPELQTECQNGKERGFNPQVLFVSESHLLSSWSKVTGHLKMKLSPSQ